MPTIIHQNIASTEAMLEFGGRLAEACPKPFVVFLYGNLGAGKTTLVRGFLTKLGHQGNVKSPTYNIVEPYQFSDFIVFHFDFYRIQEVQELEYIGIQDYFTQDAICLIEWPVKGVGLLPAADLSCYIESRGTEREIKMIAHSDRGQESLKRFENEK